MEVSMKVGPYNFEPVAYSPEVDHLRAGGGQVGDSFDGRHVFFFLEGNDDPVGLELFGPRDQLAAEGKITVTLPSGKRVRLPAAEQIVRRATVAAA